MSRFQWVSSGRFLATLLLIVGTVSGPASAAVQDDPETYPVFGPGDGVKIQVWENWQAGTESSLIRQFSGEYAIDGNGYIVLPIVGKMKVSGYTTQGLEEALKEKLSVYAKEPIVMVTPLIRVTLMGAFRRPGAYRIAPDRSLWELIEKAGGVSDDCEIDKMWVERGGQVVVKGLLNAFERGYSLQDIGVRSGDLIKAPSRRKIKFKDIIQISSWITSYIILYFQIQRGRY